MDSISLTTETPTPEDSRHFEAAIDEIFAKLLASDVRIANDQADIDRLKTETRDMANSSLKCNTCSKLMLKGESIDRASMALSLSEKEQLRGTTMLIKPTLRSGSLDQGVALHF
jgi:hypothetical protein